MGVKRQFSPFHDDNQFVVCPLNGAITAGMKLALAVHLLRLAHFLFAVMLTTRKKRTNFIESLLFSWDLQKVRQEEQRASRMSYKPIFIQRGFNSFSSKDCDGLLAIAITMKG